MKEFLLFLCLVFVAFNAADSPSTCSTAQDLQVNSPDFEKILAKNAKVEKVAGGFKFTEGPVFSRLGYLLFADIPNNVILKYVPQDTTEVFEGRARDLKSQLAVFRNPSNGANGLTFDRQGRLLACESQTRRVTRAEKDGSITVLADKYQGKRLNRPNDIVHAIDGSTYFTDPAPGGLPAGEKLELPYAGVYQITRRGEVKVVATDFERPNGIALSPTQQILYVNDSAKNHIRAFDLQGDGSLGHGRIFAQMRSQAPGAADGMKTDVEGNVYSTGPGGIWVFDKSGKHQGTIVTPEVSANLAWGDNYKTLYITARTSLYRIKLEVVGTRTF